MDELVGDTSNIESLISRKESCILVSGRFAGNKGNEVPFPFTVTVGRAPDEVCLASRFTVGVADATAASAATTAENFILNILNSDIVK